MSETTKAPERIYNMAYGVEYIRADLATPSEPRATTRADVERELLRASGLCWEVDPENGCRAFLASEPRVQEAGVEEFLGLHEGIEIVYVVDGYEATLTTHDGATSKATGTGATVAEALRALARALSRIRDGGLRQLD